MTVCGRARSRPGPASTRRRCGTTSAGAWSPRLTAHSYTEVEQKIADLEVIRDTLRAAVAAGCDDLVACAASPGCPVPFVELTRERNAEAAPA